MSILMSLPSAAHDALAKKPAHGAPCNRCGLCCMASLCDLGQHVFKRHPIPGPCPALTKQQDGYACGLALDPRKHMPVRAARHGVGAMRSAALFLIGAGDKCDARFNGEWRNVPFAEELDRVWKSGERVDQAERAKRLWGA